MVMILTYDIRKNIVEQPLDADVSINNAKKMLWRYKPEDYSSEREVWDSEEYINKLECIWKYGNIFIIKQKQ